MVGRMTTVSRSFLRFGVWLFVIPVLVMVRPCLVLATPDMRFDVVTLCCVCSSNSVLCEPQFQHLNFPSGNGHFVAMGDDTHRAELLARRDGDHGRMDGIGRDWLIFGGVGREFLGQVYGGMGGMGLFGQSLRRYFEERREWRGVIAKGSPAKAASPSI
jgi:hypothetical protein